MISFPLKTEFIELSQLLKAAGLCESGGHAKQVIQEGKVKVDGQLETRRGRKIRPGNRVEYNGETVMVPPPA